MSMKTIGGFGATLKFVRRAVVITVLLFLSACGSGDPSDDAEAGDDQSSDVATADDGGLEDDEPAGDGDDTESVEGDEMGFSIVEPGAEITYSQTPTAIELDSGFEGEVAISSTTTDVCAIEDDEIVSLRSGTCRLVFESPGLDPVNYEFEILRADADLRITGELGDLVAGGVGRLITYQTASSGEVSFESSDTEVCTVTGDGEVIPVAVGSCNVGVAVAQTTTHDSDEVGLLEIVSPRVRKEQTISLLAARSTGNVGETVTVGAESDAQLAISLRAWPEDVCSVSSAGVVSLVGGGVCEVSGMNDGNTIFSAARDQIAIAVRRLGAELQWTAVAGILEEGASARVQADAKSDADIVLSIESGPCSIDGRSIAGNGTGTCVVVASVEETQRFASDAIRTEVKVIEKVKTPIEVSWTGVKDLHPDEATTVTATATPAVTLSVLTGDVCSLSQDGLVEPLRAGTCSLRAFRAEDDRYQPVDVERAIQITKRQQVVEVMEDLGLNNYQFVRARGPVHELLEATDWGAGTTVKLVDGVSDPELLLVSAGDCPITALESWDTVNWDALTTWISFSWDNHPTRSCVLTVRIPGDHVWEDYELSLRFRFRTFEIVVERVSGQPAVCLVVGEANADRTSLADAVNGQQIEVSGMEVPGLSWGVSTGYDVLRPGRIGGTSTIGFDFQASSLGEVLNRDIEVAVWINSGGDYASDIKNSILSTWNVVEAKNDCKPGEYQIGLV